jgi:hypothetical protein
LFGNNRGDRPPQGRIYRKGHKEHKGKTMVNLCVLCVLCG